MKIEMDIDYRPVDLIEMSLVKFNPEKPSCLRMRLYDTKCSDCTVEVVFDPSELSALIDSLTILRNASNREGK